MRKKGSDGGHNGLANINQILGTSDYCRIRVGIGNGFPRGGQVDYVLGRFEGEEAAKLPEVLKRAAQGVKDFTFMGADRAMNICNTDPKKSEPKESKPKESGSEQSEPKKTATVSETSPQTAENIAEAEPKELSFKDKLLNLFRKYSKE